MLNSPVKTRAYRSLYAFNRGLEITLLSLERLEKIGIFQAEELRAFKVSLEHTRALANEEMAQTLQRLEANEAFTFERLEREREKQGIDPDDVFFAAANRRQEIKEQIRSLEQSLARLMKTRSTRKRK